MGLLRRRSAADAVTDITPAPDAARTLHAGAPGRCSVCNGFGYIDNIDMVNRLQTQHCRDCGHSWSFNFDDDGDVLDLTDAAIERMKGEDRSIAG